MKNTIDYLVDLLSIPSPTGNTKAVMEYVHNELLALGLTPSFTNKKALVLTLPGKDSSKGICLSAHVDTLGAMVRSVKENGRLRLTQIGGYNWETVEGQEVYVETHEGKKYTGTILIDTASKHIFSAAEESPRNDLHMELRLDEVVKNPEDVKTLGICAGDYVCYIPEVQVTESGFIKSRHLDDKACVAALLTIAGKLKDTELPYDIHFFISNYEEVGHGSSAGVPENTITMLALDMACVGDDLNGDEQKCTICAKDSSGPYDYDVKNHLIDLARKHQIPYTVDIYPYYGSDASAAQRAGGNFKAGLIGPGVDASHNKERTHSDAIQATVDLAILFAKNPL